MNRVLNPLDPTNRMQNLQQAAGTAKPPIGRQVMEYGSPSLGGWLAPLADLMHSIARVQALWSL